MTAADPVDPRQPRDHRVRVVANGIPREATVPARRLLSDFLRHDLELTGTHVGCEHGVCGACTVLVDGLPLRSCLTFAVTIDGREVTTIEGLAATDGTLHPVQQAFRDHHGLQCGFCTPGFVMSACAYLADVLEGDDGQARASDLEPDDIREAMAGNLCRCTGYAGIVAAVHQAAGTLAASGASPVERHVRSGDDEHVGASGDGR